MEEQKQIPLLPVLSVNFIGMLGYSIIMPFLIFIVQRFEGNEFMYGLLASVYPLFQFPQESFPSKPHISISNQFCCCPSCID